VREYFICIRRSAKEVLGVSKGGRERRSGAWWWNEKVTEKIKEKQKAYAALSSCTSEEEKRASEVTYNVATKLGKKVVAIAKNDVYERIISEIGDKEGRKIWV